MENKICQSCGMPITSDEQLGTNALYFVIKMAVKDALREYNNEKTN